MAALKLPTLAVSFPLSPRNLELLKKVFQTVYHYPTPNTIPTREELKEVDVWFWTYMSPLPTDGEFGIKDMPKLKVVQLASAGANVALKHPFFKDPEVFKQLDLCSASGIHVYCIPSWIIGQIVNLYMNIHTQIYLIRSKDAWPERSDLTWGPGTDTKNPTGPASPYNPLGFYTLRGKTAGILGYGHIGRETARLLKAFGCNILAANSAGQKKADDGYVLPGTGDLDGSLPSAWYSSNDPSSFLEFFKKSDIVIASLPSTPATTYLVKREHLDAMPKGGVFLNVGRGDLVKSDDLLEALNSSPSRGSGLWATALDVTDPEPLPAHHPLFTHPRVIITPHTSGNFLEYMDAATDLLVANVENIRKGGRAYNSVDPEKGY